MYRHVFREPDVLVRVACDIHPREVAWIAVVPHPFFAVADMRGRYEIKGLPPGRYAVEAWHESGGRVSRRITLVGGARLDFVLDSGK